MDSTDEYWSAQPQQAESALTTKQFMSIIYRIYDVYKLLGYLSFPG
jgi:hypothetical protein